MLTRIMKKEDLIDALSMKTGFFKKDIKEMVEAYSDILIEQLSTATLEEESEFHIAPGIVICGRRVPEQNVTDPRNGSIVSSPEKVIPFAVFKQSIRQKLRVAKSNKRKKAN